MRHVPIAEVAIAWRPCIALAITAGARLIMPYRTIRTLLGLDTNLLYMQQMVKASKQCYSRPTLLCTR
jgi:hypothetical protein